MAQDKFFQEQFYYEYRTNALKYIDQRTVTKIIAAYKNIDLKLEKIMEMFPDAPVSKKLHHNLPYERTKEKCICGGFVYEKVPSRQAKEQLLLCPNCGHDQYGRGGHLCECRICRADKEAALHRVREKFQSAWDDFYNKEYDTPYALEELSQHDIETLERILTSENIIERTDSDFKIKYFQISELVLDPIAQDLSLKLDSLIKKKILIPMKDLNLAQIDRLRRDFRYHHFHILQDSWITTLRWTLNLRGKTQLLKRYNKQYYEFKKESNWLNHKYLYVKTF